MCGRFTLTSDPAVLHAEFGIEPPPDYRARYNIAPTQPVLAVVANRAGEWRGAALSWGLVPHWARDRREAARRINARAETLLERPAFRDAFLTHRCLIPADGFYEWEKAGGHSRPVLIRRADGRPFALAGLWARWLEQPDQPFYSCTIITTRPTPQLAHIHDRMPVILGPRARETWLSHSAEIGALQALLGPAETEPLEWFPVSTLVNSASNDGPECIRPLG
jgi:putative SOS response-associated peptidase YedK